MPARILNAAPPFVLALGIAAPALRYFESFPNGWDQTEYCWAVRDGFLPHGPYLLYVALGRLFAVFAPPPVALSLLSFVSLLGAVGLFYAILLRFFDRKDAPHSMLPAFFGAACFGLCFAVFRQGMTQEVYTLQTCLILASVLAGSSRRPGAAVVSGALFAAALSTHLGSVFAAPALAYLWFASGDRRRAILAAATAVAGFGIHATVLAVYAPPYDATARLSEFASYLRGIEPPLPVDQWSDPAFWRRSIAGVWNAVTSTTIPVARPPVATSPLGIGIFAWTAAALGVGLGLLRGGLWGIYTRFWLLLALPFVTFVLIIGRGIDFGVHVPFLIPSVMALASLTIAQFHDWVRQRAPAWPAAAGIGAVVLALGLALWPSISLLVAHRGAVDEERRIHFGTTTLAARWVAEHTPPDSVVFQSPQEWNNNILPYYSSRQHVIPYAGCYAYFDDRGPGTPLNGMAFGSLTTEVLLGWLDSGRPVLAFEPDPLGLCAPGTIDRDAVLWRPQTAITAADLARVAPFVAPSDLNPITLYRAVRADPP